MDDGGGSVAAWEAVRLIQQLGLRPRRTVRVVLWTNEENGGRGRHGLPRTRTRRDLAKHVMAMESDRRRVQSAGGPGRLGPLRRSRWCGRSASLLRPIGADRVTRWTASPAADIEPLVTLGVPGIGLDVDGSRYFWYHHTDGDTLDKLDPGGNGAAASPSWPSWPTSSRTCRTRCRTRARAPPGKPAVEGPRRPKYPSRERGHAPPAAISRSRRLPVTRPGRRVQRPRRAIWTCARPGSRPTSPSTGRWTRRRGAGGPAHRLLPVLPDRRGAGRRQHRSAGLVCSGRDPFRHPGLRGAREVHATLADRDKIGSDDFVQILLGTFGDGRQATVFAVNPLGCSPTARWSRPGRCGGNGFTSAVVRRETADLSPDYVYRVERPGHRAGATRSRSGFRSRVCATRRRRSRPGAQRDPPGAALRRTRTPGPPLAGPARRSWARAATSSASPICIAGWCST